jgi:alpha-glucosidase
MAVFQQFSRDQPGMHAIVAEFRRLADRYDGRVLLGEAYTDVERLARYYGTAEEPELHLPLNPAFLRQQWEADEIWQGINDYLGVIPQHGWPTWSLGNHDMNRLAGRAHGPQLRVAAMLLMTLRGTPTLYYGDEIGMHDVPVPPEMTEDPQGRRQPDRSRDVARTAMQWDDSPHAGFTTGKPSVVVGSDYRQLNVAAQERDPHSLLNLYRRLIALRKEKPALSAGLQSSVQRRAPTIAYLRKTSEQRILVILNLSGDSYSFDFTDYALHARLLLSTHAGSEGESVGGVVDLHGNEGVILELA